MEAGFGIMLNGSDMTRRKEKEWKQSILVDYLFLLVWKVCQYRLSAGGVFSAYSLGGIQYDSTMRVAA